MKREYPRQAWVLLPSFKPEEVTVTGPSHPYSTMFEDWEATSKGKGYHLKSLFESKAAAIENGREQIEKQRADLAKRQNTLNKRIAALDKAEGDVTKLAAPSTADSGNTVKGQNNG